MTDGDIARGRAGVYCSGNDGARFEQIVVLDRARRAGRWLLHDEPGAAPLSDWRFSHGAFTQTAKTVGGVLPALPGATALAGDLEWWDYRLRVRIRADDAGAFGLLFRYQDADNYYRFSMGATPDYRRLIRREKGVVTTLWQDNNG